MEASRRGTRVVQGDEKAFAALPEEALIGKPVGDAFTLIPLFYAPIDVADEVKIANTSTWSHPVIPLNRANGGPTSPRNRSRSRRTCGSQPPRRSAILGRRPRTRGAGGAGSARHGAPPARRRRTRGAQTTRTRGHRRMIRRTSARPHRADRRHTPGRARPGGAAGTRPTSRRRSRRPTGDSFTGRHSWERLAASPVATGHVPSVVAAGLSGPTSNSLHRVADWGGHQGHRTRKGPTRVAGRRRVRWRRGNGSARRPRLRRPHQMTRSAVPWRSNLDPAHRG